MAGVLCLLYKQEPQTLYAALLAKLSGIDPPKKKVRQGHQQFMHECSDILQPLYNAAWDIKGWRRTIKMMWTSIQR